MNKNSSIWKKSFFLFKKTYKKVNIMYLPGILPRVYIYLQEVLKVQGYPLAIFKA